MCPVCMATAALIAGSAAGSGGLTALTVGLFRRKTLASKISQQTDSEEVQYGDQHNRTESSESGIAG